MSYIDDVFGVSGLLADTLEGYEPRPGQIAMAKAVDRAISEGSHLMVEAPCGVGKSLAYGVPAARHVAEHGKRVVIVTANIALQEQLFTKDLPFLASVLPWDFSFALIKGRSNYICVDQWQLEQEDSRFKGRSSRTDLEKYRKILKWASRTRTGDKSELDFSPPPAVWRLFSIGSDNCKGRDCRHYNECFAEKAREEARRAGIFVTNYHMLFAHLSIRAKTTKDMVLPPFDIAICDEAHKAADIARDFNGFRITEGSVRFASRLLGRLQQQDLYEELEDAAVKFFVDVKKFYRSRAYKTRFKASPDVRWGELRTALGNVGSVFYDAALAVQEDRDEKATLMRASGTAERMAWNLQAAMTLSDDNWVYYLEPTYGDKVALMGKPIQVAEYMRAELFEKTSSVIMTSATLSVNGGFHHVISETGAPQPDELVVDSPFDFEKQALLVVPAEVPMPNDRAFPEAVATAVAEAVKLAEGRVLGLFTSYKNLNIAHGRLLDMFLHEDSPYTILRQGERPRTALVEDFRKDVRSVLLGTESFWTGVDVPGESLSCVVIDRLPFQTPDDPVLDAISSRNPRWFMTYSVPRAVIAFKQGFGRLIRRTSDRGVVVLLDRRIVAKPYGRIFLASLPPVMKSQKLGSIKVFLEMVT